MANPSDSSSPFDPNAGQARFPLADAASREVSSASQVTSLHALLDAVSGDWAMDAPDAAEDTRDAVAALLPSLREGVVAAQAQPLRLGDALVAVRRLPFSTTRIADAAPAWSSGLAVERRIGPLRDRYGRPLWIDTFRRVRQLRFVRVPGGAPFLSLPLVQAGFATRASRLQAGSEIALSAGSVWFATGLVSSAPAGVMTGVRILGGRLRFSADVQVDGDEVLVPEAVEITLSLDIRQPEADATLRGSQFAQCRVRMPERLHLRVSLAGARLRAEGEAALQVWGTEVALAPTKAAPLYRADLNRLIVPMHPSPDAYAVEKVVSAHFVPEGKADIAEAGWALPAAVIAPADLGDAAGVGALMLQFAQGLRATWRGETRRAALGEALLLLDESRLAFSAIAAPSDGRTTRPARAGATGGTLLQYARLDAAPLHYFTGSDGAETVLLAAAVDLRPSRPIDVRGDRVSAWLPTALVALVSHPTQGESLLVGGLAAPPRVDRPIAFGLTNAVLRTSLPRTALLIARTGDDGTLIEGRTFFAYELAGMLPSLPDPYAANARVGARFGAARQGYLVSVHRFDASGDGLEFLLPPGAGFDPSTLIAGSVSASAAGTLAATDGQNITHQSAGHSAVAAAVDAGLFDFERQPRIMLLDVSSNASRFGVAVVPPRSEWREEAKQHPLQWPAVKGMDFAVDGRMLTLVTLPAVQWEPVRALPGPEPFPDEVRYANSGVPTVIDVPSVTLVPVDPLNAYRKVLDNFKQPQPRPSHARFTLPFGMIARARLAAPGPGRGTRVDEMRPTADDLQGAHQLRLRAQDPALPPTETAAMPGFVAQLSNAMPTGGGAPVSILGASGTTIFNNALGPAGTSPLVPVTRIDLSGHGESLFSRWANPEDPVVGVTKVEFQVLNGRAAHEVVQLKSILMPYFVPVVRTITLERKGNAVFTRHDSGWVAVRDGNYAHPGIATHPGVVLRATRVTNIRETGTSFDIGSDTYVAAYFDADLVLDGAAAPVAARRQSGYVRLSTTPMTPADYKALIERVGPMGGPVDASIAIGGGRHRMRLHRVGVGVAGFQFAMAAWGSLQFPGGGDWSVLEAEDALDAPAPVAADRGLPLIRQGVAGAATSAPYRFADPEDLFDPASPQRDYGILHAMGTQRAFYRRPRIEAASPHRIVSSERPVLADPMVLATAVGPFPRQADAIPLPTANYALEVRGDGSWRLDAPTDFPAGVGRRTLRAAGTVRSDVDYAAAMVTYAFDTADPVPWRFALKGATKIMAHTSMGDVMTMVADIDARAGAATVFADPQLKLGGPFDIIEDLLTVLKDLGIPVRPDVRMTNKWGLLIGFRVPFVGPDGKDIQLPPLDPCPVLKFADTGLKIEFEVTSSDDKVMLEIGGSPMFGIKTLCGLFVVAIIKFKLQLSTKTGTTYSILIGVGIAYEMKAGPFKLKGLFAITFFAVFGDTVLGYGIGFLVKLSASIPPIVSIELSLEGKLARLVADKGLPTETVFQIAKLVFAIEVSVFLVFSISLEVTAKKIEVMSGPLLESDAPDVL